MKKYTLPVLSLILLSALLVTSCSPYKDLQKMKSMTELPYPVSYIELDNDIKLAYTDAGSGEQTIIFIHGLGSYLPAWNKNIEVLKDSYRCIAIDLPGYGKSSKDAHPGTMSWYADVVMEFAAKMGIEHPVLAGHSMGGQIAMVAALRYPERVSRLILVDPAGFERFTEGQKQWFRDVMTVDLTKKTTAEQVQVNLAYNFYNLPDDAEFMIRDRLAMREADDFEKYCYAVTKSVSGMVNEPVIDKLDQIKQPVLVFFGENDNLIPNRYLNPGKTEKIAREGAAKLPNAQLIMIPKCGHFAQFEKADEVNAGIRNFLD